MILSEPEARGPNGYERRAAGVARPRQRCIPPKGTGLVPRIASKKTVVGLQASTTIAAATQIYLRYDGEIATGTDNHALNVGLRMSW